MTPTYQLQIAGDVPTRTLYRELRAGGETEASLDQGFSSLSYTAARRGRVNGSGNQRIQDAELFERLVQSSSHAAAYQRFAGEPLPWQASGHPNSVQVLASFDASVAAWRRDHNLPTGVSRALAEHIFDWVTSSSGLGLTIVENEIERNVDQVFASRRGDCTESTKTLLNLLSRVGFHPYPVWVHVDSDGHQARHIVTGLDIGGQTYLLDPVFGGFNQPHRQFTRLSMREFLAWHWNNRALDQRSSAPQTALTHFARALQIDPNNPHILLNRGFVRRDNLSDPTGARADFQAALALDASFSPASFELGNMAFDAGRYNEAAVFYRQAVTSDPQNASYRRNLVLALGRLGSTREAGPHFSTLCRLDPQASDLPRLARLIGAPWPQRPRQVASR